jgi:hypothetical protein
MIRLASGDDALVVSAEHGGAIVGWTRTPDELGERPGKRASHLQSVTLFFVE